jgi:hypothetical protein
MPLELNTQSAGCTSNPINHLIFSESGDRTMGLFRYRPKPVGHLRKDARTPNGTIWTCFATPEEEEALEEPEILDRDQLLNAGDIVNVKPCQSRRRFSVRVRNRQDSIVSITKIR